MGNSGDARLIVYLNEHWYLVLKGQESWLNPPFFYPTKGLLGWSDTVFLYQIFYAPLRACGMDPFLSFQLTVVGLSAVGFAGFVLLARLAFRAPMLPALAGAFVFTFANGLWSHAGSPQLFGVYFVPAIVVIGLLAWRDVAFRPARSLVLSVFFGLLTGLVLFTSYYMAWMSLLAAAVVLLVALASGPRIVGRALIASVRKGWLSIVGALVALGLGTVPFLVAYLPVVDDLGARRYKDALAFAPSWHDVFNVGSGNLIWGSLIRHLRSGRPVTYEVSYAVTPLLLFLVVAGGVAVARAAERHLGAHRRSPSLGLVLALSALILAVLPVETGWGSAWVVVWHIPGATAIRAIDRIQVVNNLIVALGLVVLATEAVTRWNNRRPALLTVLAMVAIVLVVIVEQVNTTVVSDLHRGAEVALIRSVRPAPRACTSFFVTDVVDTERQFYEYQIDAMLISQRVRLPTVNGYSGNTPRVWNLLFPERPGYPTFVRAWADQHGLLGGLCDLELSNMTWIVHPKL